MKIWAIADLHLAISCPEKDMAIFGSAWERYMERLAYQWDKVVGPKDLVLIPGDISWAMRTEEAKADLEWVDKRPGKKVMIRGNHDYWWTSIKKVRAHLPPTIEALHHSAVRIGDVAICGTRLWDSSEYSFDRYIKELPNPKATQKPQKEDEKIFQRELNRLEMALNALDKTAPLKIVMTHYPPIGADLAPSQAGKLIESAGVDICLFGHLHNLARGKKLFGKARGVHYLLTSADYLEFNPLEITTAPLQ